MHVPFAFVLSCIAEIQTVFGCVQVKRLKKDKKQLKKTIAELKETINELKSGDHDIRLEGTSQRDMETILHDRNQSPDIQKQLHQHDSSGTLAAFWKEQVSSNPLTLTVPVPLTLTILILCILRWTGHRLNSSGNNGTPLCFASCYIYGRRWAKNISASWRRKRYCARARVWLVVRARAFGWLWVLVCGYLCVHVCLVACTCSCVWLLVRARVFGWFCVTTINNNVNRCCIYHQNGIYCDNDRRHQV